MQSWPPYRKPSSDRTLAWLYFKEGKIVDETGIQHIYDDPGELIELLFTRNLLVFYRGNLTTSPLFGAALSKGWLSYSPRLGGIAGIRARHSRYARWIVSADAYQLHGPHDFPTLRTLWELTGIYGCPTSASLGQALMRREYNGPGLYSPPLDVRRTLKDTLIGGRADLFKPGKYETIIEEDLNSAYAAALAEPMPAGHPIPFSGLAPEAAHWIAEASWTPAPGVFPPVLPVRSAGVTEWPGSGHQRTWLTSVEAHKAQEMGYRIKVRRGWFWPHQTAGFRPWLEYMTQLREQVAGCGLLEALVKQATVAAIGRFGQDYRKWKIRPSAELTADMFPDVRGMANQGRYPEHAEALECFAHGEVAESPELLPQLAAFVNARVRCWLWKRMSQCRPETLIGSNYDAIYLTQSSGLPTGTGPGEWKRREHHSADLPAKRWLLSDEVDKRPGLPLDGRLAEAV